jgi:two-component system sensor kinase FixL
MSADSQSMPLADAAVKNRPAGDPGPVRPAVRRTPMAWIQQHGAWLGLGALFWIAYALADSATSLFPHPRFGVQPWSPHPALAVALVAYGGAGYLPVVLLAVLCGWWFAPGGHLDAESILAAAAMAAVYGGGGLALRRWARWRSVEIRPRDVHLLLGVSLAVAILAAGIDGLRQVAAFELDASSLPLLVFRLFVANILGLVVLAPALLQWGAGAWRWQRWRASLPVIRDALIFVVALAGLLVLVFGLRPLDEFRMSYLLFLPMIVVAMRYGLFGAAVAIPAVQAGLLGALTLIGTRPGIAFEFQLLMLTLAIAALYLGALSDERQRSAQRLAEHERALRERSHALAEAQRIASTAELAAALAHDLSQPLSAIGTYARASQVLSERGDAEHPKLVETLAQIAQESARAGQYLRRMREFFRTGSMREERIDVAALVAGIHAHFRGRLVRHDIQWHTSLEPDLPPVCADAVQVEAVLGNLVANACDVLADHVAWRQILIRAFRVPGATTVRILVEDTGPGVPAEVRDRLFRPLATSKPNGMGLGLALSRSIMERQGGRLWFDAERGVTTFCLDLRAHA